MNLALPHWCFWVLGSRDDVQAHTGGSLGRAIIYKCDISTSSAFLQTVHYQNHGARCSTVVRTFACRAMSRRIDPLSYFSFQPEPNDWCNKGRGMCSPVCELMHIKEPLLLIEKSSPCIGSGFPISLSDWCFTVYLTPYNSK